MGRWATMVALAALAACSSTGQGAPPAVGTLPLPAPASDEAPAELRAGLPSGYLARGAAPNSLNILPPPPEPGSAAFARDQAAASAAIKLNGGPRWKQAVQDADLKLPDVTGTFACALGIEISEAGTPKLFALLKRSMVDVGLSTYPTKNHYQRTRPFVVNSTPTCSPHDEAFLRKDGSYPSGHSAVGWGWALILSEVAPDRADAILARGRAFGQSRVVCNVHWLSDTEEGRVIAAATVARLHAEPDFLADLEAARGEIVAARSAGSHSGRDCETEAAQLAAG